ncbi:hypothetical protein [Synechococcus sp. PCC 7336]|nr:hypothetical protein [Synechococcus sp. PCC 7336]
MTTESAIATPQTADGQALEQQQSTSFFCGCPIASNEIDSPEELMGYLD